LFGGYRLLDWSRDIDGEATFIKGVSGAAVSTKTGSDLIIEGLTITGPDLAGSMGVVTHGNSILSRNSIHGGAVLADSTTLIGLHIIGDSTELRRNTIGGGTVTGSSSSAIGVKHSAGLLIASGNTIDGGTVSGSNGQSIGLHVAGGVDDSVISANTINGGSAKWATAVKLYGPGYLVNNFISTGDADNAGWGVGISGSPAAVLINNTLSGGPGTLFYALVIEEDTYATLVNNILGGDDTSLASEAYGIFIDDFTGNVKMAANDIWLSNPTCLLATATTDVDECLTTVADINACDWSGCYTSASNISADPMFVSRVGGDFHIISSSSCVDGGVDPSQWDTRSLDNKDFDGNIRPQMSTWDIGADEYVP
jgi:hypothetical protein